MSLQGQTINWSNYNVSDYWRQTYDTGKTSAAVYPTVYVFAPTWQAEAKAYGSGLWGWQYAALTAYYLNDYGEWTQVWSKSCETRGASNEKRVLLRHNYGESNVQDPHHMHTWKLVGDLHGDGSGRIIITAGGIENYNDSQYNMRCKDGYISGISGGLSTSSYETTGSNRGTPISVASGTYKWICN